MNETERAWESLINALTTLTKTKAIKWDGSVDADPPNAITNLRFLVSENMKQPDPTSNYGFVLCLKTWNRNEPISPDQFGEGVTKLAEAIRKDE